MSAIPALHAFDTLKQLWERVNTVTTRIAGSVTSLCGRESAVHEFAKGAEHRW